MFNHCAARVVSFAAVALSIGACTSSEPSSRSDTPADIGAVIDSMLRPDSVAPAPIVRADSARAVRPRRPAPLSPIADTIAERLVFTPATQSWFVAAARGKRMLVDIGRVDIEVRRDPARLAAYKTAVAARSRIPVGARLRLRGPWGGDDAVVTGFDTWNGRIVAVIESSPRVDSLAQTVDPLPATAQLADSAAPPSDPACAVASVPAGVLQRATVVRDSLEQLLRSTAIPPTARLVASVKIRSTQMPGCFGEGKLLLLVTLFAGNYEWVRERAVLLSDTGTAMPLRVIDYRFKAHEPMYAFDGDGDGIDDLAARGLAERAGATIVLRFADGKQLERLAGGFAWESR